MPKPATIDDNARYRITINQPIKVDPEGRVVLLPTTDNVVKGSFLKTLDADAILTAALVDPPPA